MLKFARKRGGAFALALAGTLVLLATAIPLVAVAGGEPTACETVSLAFVQKTLKLGHSGLLRDHSNLEDTAGLEPSQLPKAAHSECGIGLWSGRKPTSRAKSFEQARAGQAAQPGVDA